MTHRKYTIEFYAREAMFGYSSGIGPFELARERHLNGLALCRAREWFEDGAADSEDSEGLFFVWEADEERLPSAQDMEPGQEPPRESLWCALRRRDFHPQTGHYTMAVVASLSAIWDPTPDYALVIEAELALEAQAREAQ